ncbi:MAG: hypothetical protein ACRDPT_06150 [Streptomycetales bacterium]
MKHMIMMFGSAAEMMETRSPEWIREVIGFMLPPPQTSVHSGDTP